MKTLKELSHDSFYNMQNYSQITIDFIEDLEDLLNVNGEQREGLETELGSLSYRISTVLDVINPELETDVDALYSLSKIINSQLDKAEYL